MFFNHETSKLPIPVQFLPDHVKKKSCLDNFHLAVSKPAIYSGIFYTLNTLILVKTYLQNQQKQYIPVYFNNLL